MRVEDTQHAPNVVMQGRINWPAAIFFALLAIVHAIVTALAISRGNSEWIVSAIFFIAFAVCLGVTLICKKQVTILPIRRVIVIQWGCINRIITFEQIRTIRLTLTGSARHPRSSIELICDDGEIECPPAKYPRQQALYLAITTGAHLLKIYGDGMAPQPQFGGRLASFNSTSSD